MRTSVSWLIASASIGVACSTSSDAPPSSGAGGSAGSATSSSVGATTTSNTTGATGTGGAGGSGPGGTGSAAEVARRLGRPAQFLIGLGNDLNNNHDMDGAYTLGTVIDLHYAYLVGANMFPWTKWNTNPDGSFANILADAAKRHGTVPMFTLYSMASSGESNTAVLTTDSYMQAYWDEAKILFQRLAAFDGPAVVHLEPDWWAFAEQKCAGDPAKLPTHVGSIATDCAGVPEDVSGMGQCLVKLARQYAPKVQVAFHASHWADPSPANIAAFLVKVGAGNADIIAVDVLDRDAGCFETHTDPNCQRNDGPWYWDETNQKSPNFHEHLAWAKAIGEGVGKPILWWQVPLGVPSATPGGSSGHYRDNRVKYIFEHADEFVAAGGLGAAFGTGAGNQTDWTTDGDQFKNAVAKYMTAPLALP